MVENVLAADFVSLRNQVYGRYVTYFQNLLKSNSREIRHLVRIVSRDSRSVTCRNVEHLSALTGLSPRDYSVGRIKEKLPKSLVPGGDRWRPGLLLKLFEMRGKVADHDH